MAEEQTGCGEGVDAAGAWTNRSDDLGNTLDFFECTLTSSIIHVAVVLTLSRLTFACLHKTGKGFLGYLLDHE